MNSTLEVRWRRIIIWLLIAAVVALFVWFLDVVYLQKCPIIWIDNYSDVVLSIWQIQTTIASLTLASTAFILGKIDNSFYGISIKNLLHLSRHFPKAELSFWEKLICSMILPMVTWIFVVLDNITAASFLLFMTVCFAALILVECINVITKSDIYANWARQIVDKLVNTICGSTEKNGIDQKKTAKEQLRTVLDGIETEVSAEIRRGIDLCESNSYMFLVQLMDRYPCEDMESFNQQMHHTVIEWLRLAINTKSEQNIHAVLRASYPESLEDSWGSTGISLFMNSYYHGDISVSCFRDEINNIVNDILQAYYDYSAKALYVLRGAIYNADVDTFVQIMKAVWRSSPYNNPQIKSNVLITAIAYLYYMAFKEKYMPIEKGYLFLERLRAFSNATIMESYGSVGKITIKDILADVHLTFEGAKFLLDYFDHPNISWEYVSLGEMKTMQLRKDSVEFLTFYCYLFMKHIRMVELKELHLEVLLDMMGFIDAEGMLNEAYSAQYAVFCGWLGREGEVQEKNEWFYISLIAAIKEKMIIEANEIRKKRDVWTKKISDMRENVIEHVSKSELCVKEMPIRERCVDLRLCDFHLLKDFSEDYGLYGGEEVVLFYLESKLFDLLQRRGLIDDCAIKMKFDDFEESLLTFEGMIKQMKQNGVCVDRSYNYPFYNRFSHRRVSQNLAQKIQIINATIQNAGRWETGFSGVAVFVDSLLEKVGFLVPDDGFMTITEELTGAELKYVCQRYKTDEGFVFKKASNSVGIPFAEEELIEYLRVAMVKIRYTFPAVLPRKKIGFATYYVE